MKNLVTVVSEHANKYGALQHGIALRKGLVHLAGLLDVEQDEITFTDNGNSILVGLDEWESVKLNISLTSKNHETKSFDELEQEIMKLERKDSFRVMNNLLENLSWNHLSDKVINDKIEQITELLQGLK